MMLIGILILLAGLYLVITYKSEGLNSLLFYNKHNNALDILKERYARGEITTDQFQTMKNILTDNN